MSGSLINRTSAAIYGVCVYKTRTNAGSPGSTAGTGSGSGFFVPAELADDRLLPPPESQIFVPPEEEAAAEEPVETFAAQFVFPDTLPDPDFFIWDHLQDQFLQFEVPPPDATVEILIAADPIPHTQDPIPGPDAFIWEHKQEQNEFLSPRVTLENLAEGGTNGVEVTTANSGGASGNAWDSVLSNGPGLSAVYFGTDQDIDTMGYRFEGIADFINVFFRWAASGDATNSLLQPQNQLNASWYMWLGSHVNTGTHRVFEALADADGTFALRMEVDNFGRPLLADRVGSTTHSTKLPLECWLRFELDARQTGEPRAVLRIYFDANSSTPDITLNRSTNDQGQGGYRTFTWGWINRSTDGDEPLTFFLDNITVDTNFQPGISGTTDPCTEKPSLIATSHPYDVVQPWEADLFRQWDHRPEQNEWLSPFIFEEAIEALIAADPMEGLELNPLPFPDFFQWNQPQDIAESAIPAGAVAEPIEVLIAADLMSSGHPPDLVPPALDFLIFDQNTDPPAGTIPPDLSGNIRRVPRWAKQKNFYAGGR